MWGQHTTQLKIFYVEILPFLFFPTFLQVKITPSDPSLDKSWTNTTELIMNNRNPEFNQTLVIEVCITIYNQLNLGPLYLWQCSFNYQIKTLAKGEQGGASRVFPSPRAPANFDGSWLGRHQSQETNCKHCVATCWGRTSSHQEIGSFLHQLLGMPLWMNICCNADEIARSYHSP